MKSSRIYLVAPEWLKREIQEVADAKGITMSEYIKDTMKEAVKLDKEKIQTGKPKDS
jgi:hypothetical protein